MSASIHVTRVAFAAGALSLGVLGMVGFLALKPATNQASPPARPIHLAELIGIKYPLGKTVEVLAAPEVGAPTITRIRQGSEVMVTGVVDGDAWYQLSLPDQELGYVQVAAIPEAAAPTVQAVQPAPAPQAIPAPQASPAPQATPAAQVVPAAPMQAAVQSPESQPPAPDMGAPPTVQIPPVVEFEDAHEVRQVVNVSAVYLKPDRLAPVAYPVAPGRQVYVVARSKDGNWAWVETADNAPAYMPMSDTAP
jgi:hypothetical protein